MLSIADSQVPPPVNWQEFERLCWLLWRSEWNSPGTQRYGRLGQEQHGVDVFGRLKRGVWAGVQCKGKDNYQQRFVTVPELKREVAKARRFRPKLSVFILATTGPRDARVQQCARILTETNRKAGLFSVQVCSWDDIREMLDGHPEIVSQIYSGAAFAKDIRGIAGTLSSLLGSAGQDQRAHFTSELDAQTATIIRAIEGKVYPQIDSHESSQTTSNQLAEIVAILRNQKPQILKERGARPRVATTILSQKRLELLSIIAVAPTALSLASYKAIFPSIDWKEHLTYFKRCHCVANTNGVYSVSPRVQRLLFDSNDDRQRFYDKWIDALEPIKWHPDTALHLAVQQLHAGRIVESLCTVINAAEALTNGGKWNEIYLSILLSVDGPKLFKLFSSEQRAHFFYSVALCLSRARRHTEALSWLDKLRRFSRRARNSLGVRNAFHASGIVHIEMGNHRQAQSCLRKAVWHAKRSRDFYLLGRALYELAIAVLDKSPEEAAVLLAQSEEIKRKNGDQAGFMGIYHGRAVLAVRSGRHREALRFFTQAVTAARRLGDPHAEALQRYNVGRTYIDLKKYSSALDHLRQAAKLAESNDFADVTLMAAGSEAMAFERQGKNKLAEKAFQRLFELYAAVNDDIHSVIALHDVGVMKLRQRQYSAARRAFLNSTRLARSKSILEWTYRGQADLATSYSVEGKVSRAIATFRKMASAEDRRHAHVIASRLWTDALSCCISNNILDDTVFELAERALTSAAKSGDSSDGLSISIHERLYEWKWKRHDYLGALDSLKAMSDCAHRARNLQKEWAAQNQLGVGLQELERFKEALKVHHKALRLARRLDDPDAVEFSLSNLGEGLRKCGRCAAAIRCFVEGERQARVRGAFEAAISIAHNRALALEHQGKFSQAAATFRQCRDESRRRHLWYEYTRALHGIANLAWHCKKPNEAKRWYVKALRTAKRYKVIHNRHQISLNYANALRWSNQPAIALKVLKEAEEQFRLEPDAAIYHSELAILYDEVGDSHNAMKQWKLANASAKRVSDSLTISLSASALGEMHDKAGRLESADESYCTALAHESDAELKVALLAQRLGILLKLHKEKEASAVFGELQALTSSVSGHQEKIDALLMLGDYNWTDGRSPREATKAYVAAMSESCSDLTKYFEIGARLSARLGRISGTHPQRKIAALKRDIVQWLEQEQGLEQSSQYVVLWPFSAGERLAEKQHGGKAVSQKEFVSIVKHESQVILERRTQ